MRAFNSQKENFLCGRKGLWTWTWSLTWTWSSNYSPWVSCFSLFVEKNCGLGLLLGAVLQLTRPTRAHGSFWLFKVSSLKIWSGVSEPSQSQLNKDKQTNLATRGPPESPWQGPWPLLMSPAHSLSMENRWISQLNCFDEKTVSPGYLKVWICFALLGSCSETHSWCKCDLMVFIGKCSKKTHVHKWLLQDVILNTCHILRLIRWGS